MENHEVIEQPGTLTPNRACDYSIVLQLKGPLMNVRSYRYPQIQEDKIKKLVRVYNSDVRKITIYSTKFLHRIPSSRASLPVIIP